MPKKLHLDIETFSSVDIASSGNYKYSESIDFEILLVAYAFDEEPIQIIDLASGEELPTRFLQGLRDPRIEKHAHNATFERKCFMHYHYTVPITEWYCSSVKAAYCGLPLSLGGVSKALELEEKGKLATGRALVKYFCEPCKPTAKNEMRTRNLPQHAPDKWEDFKLYCINDVEAEREIIKQLEGYAIPEWERRNYILDQEINDRGIFVDTTMVEKAVYIDGYFRDIVSAQVKEVTGLENPNSPAQLKEWLSNATGKNITTLAKNSVLELLECTEAGAVSDVLEGRQKMAKSSIKKYAAMLNCVCVDGRAHGLFQFYGANRTGRWAGRLIQLQNLPQNHMSDLQLAREVISSGDHDLASMLYDNVPNVLSELIRTAFIAERGNTFAVADFSAIEARVVSWLAGERWRLEVFETHGKIYEASAAMMFGVPIESVTKGSDLRAKGKVAELALGYQGGVEALRTMGGERMGLSDAEMKLIVTKWRKANPAIVEFWAEVDEAATRAIKTKKPVVYKNLTFSCDDKAMQILLPSGRSLFYWEPRMGSNRFGNSSIQYRGMNQETKQWSYLETYGGKLTENIVQAVSRDLLADAMLRINGEGFKIVMHVHDEVVCEIPDTDAKGQLERMCEIMGVGPDWAPGLPLNADGYSTPFYKKD